METARFSQRSVGNFVMCPTAKADLLSRLHLPCIIVVFLCPRYLLGCPGHGPGDLFMAAPASHGPLSPFRCLPLEIGRKTAASCLPCLPDALFSLHAFRVSIFMYLFSKVTHKGSLLLFLRKLYRFMRSLCDRTFAYVSKGQMLLAVDA